MKNFNKAIIIIFTSLLTFSALGQAVSNSQSQDSNSMNITDQERHESQNYVHEGLAKRQADEECAKLDDPSVCQGREAKSKFMGMDSNTVKMVAKAYSMVIGFADIGSFKKYKDTKPKTEGTKGTDKTNSATPPKDPPKEVAKTDQSAEAKDNAAADKTGEERETEEQKDYCKYIPLVGEQLASFSQSSSQEDIYKQVEDKSQQQKNMLRKAARSHAERAKNSKTQMTWWGLGAACYSYYVATAFFGNTAHTWSLWLKWGASVFMTMFYKQYSEDQQKYADEVNRIADGLTGRGGCNAITEKDCYCAQPETMYDPRCLPQMKPRKVADGYYQVPCTDSNLKVDAKCTCIDSNSCFDQEFMNTLNLPGAANFINSREGSAFRNLTRGAAPKDTFSSATGLNVAKQKSLLGDFLSKNGPPSIPSLNSSQKAEADSLKGYGLPSPLRSLLASKRADKASLNKIAGLSKGTSMSPYVANYRGGSGSKVLSFGGGSGFSPIKAKASKGSNHFDLLNKFGKKKTTKQSGEVLNFREKATRQAQINKNSERPIFEIISRRYQVSGWKRLELK